jgi:hypothetical protein
MWERPRLGAAFRKWLPGVGEDANCEFSISLLPTTPELPKMRKRGRDRAEALRLAGGPKRSLRDRAVALANERGLVRTRELTDIARVGLRRAALEMNRFEKAVLGGGKSSSRT